MSKVRYIYDENSAQFIPTKKNTNTTPILLTFIATLLLSGILVFLFAPALFSNSIENEDTLALQEHYKSLQLQAEQTESLLKEIQQRDNELYRSYFNLDTISSDVRTAGIGGVDRYSQYKKMPFGNLVSDVTQRIDGLNRQLSIQLESLKEIEVTAEKKEEIFAHIPAIQPVANKDLKRLASGFGYRIHPIYKIAKLHEGIDFTADTGTPIYATADGVVEEVGVKGGYGNATKINHGNGIFTFYAHQSKINVTQGQKVKRGEVIGYVGSTGLSSGPHLHYEVIKDGQKVDPINYFYQDLSPTEFNELIENTQKMSYSFD